MRTLIQALKTKELRNKILFTLGIIIIYRIGSFIPTPGVDFTVVQQCVGKMNNASENFIGLVNLFSGGAMLQLSIFALGVMPYITASIVIQLLRVVIPRFEALHKEGQSGEAKLTQYTRYLTIGLAVLQSTTILVTARSGALFNYQCSQVVPDGSVWNLVVMVLIMTGGTGLIMWMAELVTDKGLGQGMSILIFMSICSGFLPQLWEIGWGTNGTDGTGQVRRGRRHPAGHHDPCHLRRACPASYSGAVHPPYDRPQDVRWLLHLPAAEDQHERRHPADLRILHPGRADADRAVRQFRPVLGQVDQLQPGQHHIRVVHRTVRADDRVLLLLLHGDHLQPGRDRRQHEAVRRLHSGHPRGKRPPATT